MPAECPSAPAHTDRCFSDAGFSASVAMLAAEHARSRPARSIVSSDRNATPPAATKKRNQPGKAINSMTHGGTEQAIAIHEFRKAVNLHSRIREFRHACSSRSFASSVDDNPI